MHRNGNEILKKHCKTYYFNNVSKYFCMAYLINYFSYIVNIPTYNNNNI